MFDDLAWFNVQVRYRTARDGYRCIKYHFQAATAELAKSYALQRAFHIRGSSMHEAEITLI